LNILIAGAQGGVAQAIGKELYLRKHRVLSLSRTDAPDWSANHLRIDCSQPDCVQPLKNWLNQQTNTPEIVIQCAGILHNTSKMPEKALSQISSDWLHQSIDINLLSHIHLAQAIDPFVKRQKPIRWVSLSALVGSLTENELGGWYSYRISKAALNMFIRNLSIEWGRKSPNSIVTALHPGTTKTALSEPFQRNIAPEKLYAPQLTGRRLSNVIDNLSIAQHGRLLHWDGTIVPF